MMLSLTLRLALLTLLAAPTLAQPALPLDRLDAYLDAERERHGLPGLAVAVVRNGEVVHARGFGEAAPGVPMRADTPLMLGSVSKGLTALAVSRLADAGRLDPEAPVRRYLPDFALADTAVASRLTVRDLLTQRSGLTQNISYATTRAGQSLAERVRRLGEVRPEGPPGEAFRYANVNYAVLGRIVEVVTDLPFEQALDTLVFAPLGMPSGSAPPGRAEGYRFWFGAAVPAGLDYPADNRPSGHLWASAEGLARVLAMLQRGGAMPGGGRFLSGTSARATTTPPDSGFYARGWIRGAVEDVPATWHGGSLPNWNAFVALTDDSLAAEPAVGVVVLTNANSRLGGSAIRAVQEGAVAVLAGREPAETGFSVRWRHGLVGLAALLWARWTARSLLRLRREARDPAARARWHARRGRLALDVLMPFVVAVAVPAVFGVGWGPVVASAPDLVLWLAAALGVGAGAAAVRLIRARPLSRFAEG